MKPSRWAILAALALLSVGIQADAQVIIPTFPETDGPVYATTLSGNTLYVGGDFSRVNSVHSGGVAIDPVTAMAEPGFPLILGMVNAVVSDGTGGWYIGGAFGAVGGLGRTNLAHVLSNHSVASWNPAPNDTVWALALAGPTLYVGGSFTQIGGTPRNSIAALDATTGQIAAWDPSIPGVYYDRAKVTSIVVQGSTIYAGGKFNEVHGERRFNFAALDAVTGAPLNLMDTNGPVSAAALSGNTLYLGGSFTGFLAHRNLVALDAATAALQSDFPTVVGEVRAVALDGAGGWYIGGAFTSVGGSPKSNLAHVLSDHSVDGWAPEPDGAVNALGVAGGTIYVGGAFTFIGGQPRNGIAAIDGGTGLATAWDPNADAPVSALVIDGNTAYAAGSFTTMAGQPRHFAAGVDLSTGQATSWDPNPDASINAIAVSGGVVYAAGNFSDIGGATRPALAALDPSTGLATPWSPPMPLHNQICTFVCDVYGGPGCDPDPCCLEGHDECYSPPGTINALVVSNSTVYIGGSFEFLGSTPRLEIAALDVATAELTPWDPGADNEVRALFAADGVIYAAGLFGTIGGQARRFAAAIDPSTGAATSWQPPYLRGTVAAVSSNGSLVCLGGSGLDPLGAPRTNLAAIDTESGTVMDWNPGANGPVSSLAANGSVIYAGGGFTSIGGQPRNHIAALDAVTAQATAWNPDASSDVFALAADGSTVYAGGSFTTVGGVTRKGVAAIDAGTALATSWNPQAPAGIRAIASNGSAVFVGGPRGPIAGIPRSNLAAINVTGGQVTSWNPGANGIVLALATGGSTVYAGGYFTMVGGQPRNHLAAIAMASDTVGSWNPGTDGPVAALAVGPTAVYAGGLFNHIGGQFQYNLGAVDRVTGLPKPMNPNPDGAVNALLLNGSTLYVGGDFQYIDFSLRNGLAALDASTGQATPFYAGTTCNRSIVSLALSGGTLYAGMTQFGCASVFACDAVTGFVIPWWHSPVGTNSVFALQASGGKLYLGGYFNHGLACVDSMAAGTNWGPNLFPISPDIWPRVRTMTVDGNRVYVGGTFSTPNRYNLVAIELAVTGVDETSPAAEKVSLGPSLPNPSSGRSEIQFRTAKRGRVTLRVFDVAGRQVRTLAEQAYDAGPHVVHWDGRDKNGRDVASGIYFCVLETAEKTRRMKMAVLH